MRNDWVAAIRAWGQNAIDDKQLFMDYPGRDELFEAVLESLRAKENDRPVVPEDFSIFAKPPLILIPLSGGLDSLVAYERALEKSDDVRAFYVDMRTPYASDELHALGHLGIPFTFIDHGDWPQRWAPYETRWQHILPLRNLLIIMSIAKEEGLRPAQIWLGATEGEIPPHKGDKSLKFFLAAQRLLDTLPVKHTLEFPLRYETKSELVKWWIDSGRDVDRLLKTITCQNPMHGLACGACHACFNRWVALTNNALYEELAVDPVSVEANQIKIKKFEEALAIRDFDTWGRRRILQSLSAWYEATNDSRLIDVERDLNG